MPVNGGEALGVVRYGVERGLIIVEDPASRDGHEDWDPAAGFVSAGPDSIYLSVQPAVDGPIDLVVSDGRYHSPKTAYVYFDGLLRTAGPYVVVRDSDDVLRFSVRRPPGDSRVRVLVDEPGLAAAVHIIISSP
ncbi:hypothetical protein HPO96_26765 [Kribbella sandramycini]|uniref:Uncharacterized protein n=1 Tax=Kribbella sandramycini TaxID=60450 RepID=A0A7Y4L5V2_9ACTN|nr:hypothetical protein [Kribbella sandramycini]MBB6570713.1 hypothetical protein [Kribbella sandramycini]NOL43856.1 hypothetical protein [Kribbella sandramycini]